MLFTFISFLCVSPEKQWEINFLNLFGKIINWTKKEYPVISSDRIWSFQYIGICVYDVSLISAMSANENFNILIDLLVHILGLISDSLNNFSKTHDHIFMYLVLNTFAYPFMYRTNEAYSKDLDRAGHNLCLFDWSFAGWNRSSKLYMVGELNKSLSFWFTIWSSETTIVLSFGYVAACFCYSYTSTL